MAPVRIAVVSALLAVSIGIAAPAPDGKRWWSFVEMLANDDVLAQNVADAPARPEWRANSFFRRFQ